LSERDGMLQYVYHPLWIVKQVMTKVKAVKLR
jgi:hypothetical protein